jgi:AcrR family transcriptional regulator
MADASMQSQTPSPPPLKGRALAKQQTREKVLAAARAMFIERGFEGATIRDIAQAAGMSTGAVFASFADKNELFFEVVGQDNAALQQVMEDASANARDLHAALMGAITANFDFNLKRLPLVQGLMAAAWVDDPVFQAQRAALTKPIFDLLTTIIVRHVERGETAEDVTPQLLLDTVWPLVLATYRNTVLKPGVPPADLLADLSRQMALVLRGAAKR